MAPNHPEFEAYAAAAPELAAAARANPQQLNAASIADLLDEHALAAREIGHECAQIRPAFLERAAQLLRGMA